MKARGLRVGDPHPSAQWKRGDAKSAKCRREHNQSVTPRHGHESGLRAPQKALRQGIRTISCSPQCPPYGVVVRSRTEIPLSVTMLGVDSATSVSLRFQCPHSGFDRPTSSPPAFKQPVCCDGTLNSRLSTLNSQLSTLDSQLSTLNSRLSTLDSQLSTLDSQLSTLNSQLSTSSTRHRPSRVRGGRRRPP